MADRETDTRLLDLAVRSAARGHGHVEPNPMVGCVISDAAGTILAAAHHERFGEPHAEVLAIAKAGASARDAIVHVTLEPCNHHGKTPPCVDALVDAGVREVVIGARDPNPQASGGMERLREAGIAARCVDHPGSMSLLRPFQTRLERTRPWITLKWAQTLDGNIATRTGESKWISSPRSRRMVHRERGRVDAIMTGIGTVLMDNPRLTARDVRIRRIAKRIVIDRSLKTPLDGELVRTIGKAPLLIVTERTELETEKASMLKSHGVHLMGRDSIEGRFDLPSLFNDLHLEHDISTVLVEAGTGLMSSLLRSNCVDELAIFTAPRTMEDPEGYPPLDPDLMEKMASTLDSCGRSYRREQDQLVLCEVGV
ncbi:MAG: bifunctional diaminohydroxyphosphoribosylaminopyrimidine deaminase/5-amino-6-(5-phosphoribosylamino)uracil reductase RibD [Phycisphaerales bacterium]|nr:bifunctional diaminohydroxyphosphoribosylaminopyrimidine deaminase/5-amino-6-(5-phosphoribosylamino)uracil reductase RibD [Phycisphaerales bacterium]